MKRTKALILTAIFALTMVFTSSCSSDGDSDGGGGTSSSSAKVKSSPSKGVSSSGSILSSSSDNSYIEGLPLTYEDQTYRTVKIGTQTWMAENLNYNIGQGSKCYDDAESNCVKYGRLYNWVTAMALPANCGNSTCSSQVQPKHRGVCPDGWHIPSASDWDILLNYVQTDNGSTYTSDSTASIAGKYLKSANGWNGEDKYGFTALPGGICDFSCYAAGNDGHWWGARDNGGSGAYIRTMKLSTDRAEYDGGADKNYYRSVRCINDNSSLDFPSSSSLGDGHQEIKPDNILQNGNMGMSFVNGALPTGSVGVIKGTRINGMAISGGSTLLTVISAKKLQELYISIEGEAGYYVQPLTDADYQMEGSDYSYSVVLQFYQQLDDGELHFEISGLTQNDELAEAVEKDVPSKNAKSGNLQISVSWDQPDDVDLHVYTPSGGHVYYDNREAGNVKLDFDSNPNCYIDDINSENIYINAPLEDGNYTIELRIYKKCNSGVKGARYHVTANYNGKFIEFSPEKQTGKFEDSATSDAAVVIGTITVRNGVVVE
jgi:uncharacterized protein (TIGR02145 family)